MHGPEEVQAVVCFSAFARSLSTPANSCLVPKSGPRFRLQFRSTFAETDDGRHARGRIDMLIPTVPVFVS